jgi:amino acid adenylation domain-containing protein
MKRAIEDIYPSTPLQQGMLYHSAAEPESGAHVTQLVGTLDGPLAPPAFRRAWQRAVDRHPVLRTSFAWKRRGEPMQVVHRDAKLVFVEEDWGGLPPEAQERRLEEFLAEDRRAGFDLERAPSLRLALFKVGEVEHRMVWTQHHAVLDGWSLPVLLHEVFAVYDEECGGTSAELGAAPRFRDYVAWLRRRDRSADERFWRAELRGARYGGGFVLDRPGAEVAGAADGVDQRRLRIAPGTAERLTRFAREQRVTTSTIVQAVWALLLGRYHDRDDVLFGSVFSGRPPELPGIERAVGMYINTVPVRVELPANEAALPWLHRMHEKLQRLGEHQYASLVELQAFSDIPRGVPFFDTLFVFENYPGAARAARSGLRLRELNVRDSTSFPLTLYATPGAELSVRAVYRAPLDGDAVSRMLGHFETLLTGLIEDPARRLSELPLLSAGERERVLREWNPAAIDRPAPRCVHELIEERVACDPDATAVLCGDTRISYGELDRRANRVAGHLRAAGAGPDVAVGICLERSAEMLVALLGTLKAGGAYIPLDPDDPPARLAYMVEDSAARLVLGRGDTLERLAGTSTPAVLLSIDELLQRGADDPSDLGPRATDPEQLAYAIYTSGSTGAPKAVGVPHRAVVHFLTVMQQVLGLDATHTMLAVTPLHFDIHVLELLLPLAVGGKVAIADVEETVDGERLAARMDLARFLCERGGNVWNLYGPTETTVWSTAERVDAAEPRVSIGRPIGHTRAYVLDSAMRPLPPGLPGELYLGGAGLARAYLGRADLTAAAFVPDPFGDEPGARLYRTGDRARHLEDGRLELLGRMDDQVKIRGFRVEPGEIETRLRERPEIRDALALIREDVPGDTRLVAYVRSHPGASITGATLREALAGSLPRHMVPAAFVFVETWPLTQSGKIDRRSLPAPGEARPSLEQAFAPPGTPTEEVLASIWSAVLGIESIGIHDDFFELGGHSLLALQVTARARRAFGVELPVREVFDGRTVAAMAASVDEAVRAGAAKPVPEIAPASFDGPVPLSFAQQRLWFLQHMQPEGAVYNFPVALRLRGALDAGVLRRALDDIVRRHEALRTVFPDTDGEPHQRVLEPRPFDLARIRVGRPGTPEQAERCIAETVVRPFDIARGPLFRATLLELDDDDHILLTEAHHIVFDGRSSALLQRELAERYNALLRDAAAPFVPLPVQYPDFTVWQRHWVDETVLGREIAYWRETLDDVAPLSLPTDHPRPPVLGSQGSHRLFPVPEDVRRGMRVLGRTEGATPFMTFLAAFQCLLARYSGQTDIALGVPIAHRVQPETEPMIGSFVNTLVLRCDLAGDPTFLDVVRRVREVALGAYAHQDVPFERLVEELRPRRDLSRTPLFQVMFNFQTATKGYDFEGLRSVQMPVSTRTSKFDLTLFLTETKHGLIGAWEYHTELFAEATIARMEEHLGVLMNAVLADPSRRLSELPLLTERERERMLVDWNATETELPDERSLHGLFERQAERTPDATALTLPGGERLGYDELNRRANRMAHHLVALGVGPERPVAVCLERSADLVVAILAVLKSGAYYVPLDPEDPESRRERVLRDSGARRMVARRDGWSVDGVEIVDPARDAERIAQHPDVPPASATTGSNLAYVIYTSGSTGVPKGVAIAHQSAVSLVHWARTHFSGDELSGTLASTSICFDLSVFELFVPLASGGAVILCENALQLGRLEAADEVTLINTVPSVMAELLRSNTVPRSVRAVNLAGEALSRELAERIHEDCPGVRLTNLYAPSETTTYSTVSGVLPSESGDVSIGRPIANTRVLVLDASLRPVPVGVTGEICIGGAGVARGYLGRPDLTAERFVPDPCTGRRGERLYRTGDLGRFRPDGSLEFLGRGDQQVKVRGFRIELGEIEAALQQHPGVHEGAVAVDGDTPQDRQLVAYFAGDPGVSTLDLRRHLRERLPRAMIPAHVLRLDALPRNDRGKLARDHLPSLDRSRRSIETEAVPARTPTERKIAEIWRGALGVDRVGAHDNFFDLGGHSLQSIGVIDRIEKALGVPIHPPDLFLQTLAQLAASCDARRSPA